jgi:hypothetical protein
MRNVPVRPLLALTALLALSLGTAQARGDVYMKQKTHTGAITLMGQTQPEKTEMVVFWLSAGKARTDAGDGKSAIYLAADSTLYAIDHTAKTYTRIPMDFGKIVEGAAGQQQDAPQATAMAQMMKGMMASMSVNVTETAETRKIGDWNCRKYLIDTSMSMMQSKAEAWATQDLVVDYDLYFTLVNAMMATMPGFDKVVEQMRKVKGVIVEQKAVTKVMGQDMTVTTELVEYAQKDAPAGTYVVPAGYRETTMAGH